jgi:predicted DNA-binding helix-hairpin-helix protein
MGLDAIDKLRVLSNDSRYDLACACGTKDEEHRKRGNDGRWIYPVVLPQGGSTFLFKTLLSNACVNDCKYCPLRSDAGFRRCTLRPDETARVFMDHYRRKQVSGLFLSSAVTGSPDRTMEAINTTALLLRRRYRFRGYIHLKIIPGASDAAIEESLSLASAVSLNIETPTKRHFDMLSKRKDYYDHIMRPLRLMGRLTGRGMRFSRVKCTTQFIVGAAEESDAEIVRSMADLYDRMNFKRIYFSAYQRGSGHPSIPGEVRPLSSPEEPFMREHRLYQVDFLLRRYGFAGDEIPFGDGGNLRLDADPKQAWADCNPGYFPVRINTADKGALLRVPGIGHETAATILKRRAAHRLTQFDDLGVKGKRLNKIMKYTVLD